MLLLFILKSSCFSNSYKFKLDNDSYFDKAACCIVNMTYQNLDPRGIELDNIILSTEDRGFTLWVHFGVRKIEYYTSIKSQLKGSVALTYTFHCDPKKSKSCPDSGSIEVEDHILIDCLKEPYKVISTELTPNQGIQLVTNLLDDNLNTGITHLKFHETKKCL